MPGIKPSGAMVMEKLDNLGEAGLKALFCGRLQEVQPVTWTKSNNPIRTGLLVDEFGTGLPIVLWGARCGSVGGRGFGVRFPRLQPGRVDQS